MISTIEHIIDVRIYGKDTQNSLVNIQWLIGIFLNALA